MGDPPATRSNRFASIDSVSRLHEHGESGGAVAGFVNGVGVLACGMSRGMSRGMRAVLAATPRSRGPRARPCGDRDRRDPSVADGRRKLRHGRLERVHHPHFERRGAGHELAHLVIRRGLPGEGAAAEAASSASERPVPRLALLASILCAFVPSSACGAGVNLRWPRAGMPAPILPLGWIILVDLHAAGARELTDR